jgi:steroid Delta-isomerase
MPSYDKKVRGTSHLRFAADGLVCYHRAYWDAAEELYEKLPVVRSVMRWLKRRANS